MRYTHISVHLLSAPESGDHSYQFNVGRDNFEKDVSWGRLVKKIEIPPEFVQPVQKRIRGRESYKSLGAIFYNVIGGKHAASTSYDPKRALKRGVAVGLAAHLELLCVEHLKEQGVKTIRSSQFVSESRRNQLHRLGLEPNRVYAIDEWIGALKRAKERKPVNAGGEI